MSTTTQARNDTVDKEMLVAKILRAQKAGDFIMVLGLASPILQEGKVEWGATEADINRCFRQMSLQVHPDKNKSNNAIVAFRALSEAQQALMDATKRRACVMKYKPKLVEEQRRRTLELRREWSQNKKASKCFEDFATFQSRVQKEGSVPTIVTQKDAGRPSTPKAGPMPTHAFSTRERAVPPTNPPPPAATTATPTPPPRPTATSSARRASTAQTMPPPAAREPSAGSDPKKPSEKRVPRYMQPKTGIRETKIHLEKEKTKPSGGRYANPIQMRTARPTTSRLRPTSADFKRRERSTSMFEGPAGDFTGLERERQDYRFPGAGGGAARGENNSTTGETTRAAPRERSESMQGAVPPSPTKPAPHIPKTTPMVDKVMKEWLDKKKSLERTKREKVQRKMQKDREWLQGMRDQARERARQQEEETENIYGPEDVMYG